MSQKIVLPLAAAWWQVLPHQHVVSAPLTLLLLGFGGAWIVSLTAFESYRPIFIGIASIALFIAYRRIYQPEPEQSCVEGKSCEKPQISDLYKRLFVAVLIVVLISITSPYLAPVIYG